MVWTTPTEISTTAWYGPHPLRLSKLHGIDFLSILFTALVSGFRVQLLSWLVVSACLLVMVAMVMIPSLVSIAATLLGGVLGVMATVLVSKCDPVVFDPLSPSLPSPLILLVQLATRSAWSLDGLLYLVAGAVTGGLLGRCYATPTTGKRRSFTDYTM